MGFISRLFIIFHIISSSLTFEDWGYNEDGPNYLDPKHWFMRFKECSGHRQSPIDLIPENIVVDRSLGPLQMLRYDQVYPQVRMVNDGRTVRFEVIRTNNSDPVPELDNDHLNASYELRQGHFHWGVDNFRGSEHMLNDRVFPLEGHLVHFLKPGSNTTAHVEQIVVLGIFFALSEKDNENLVPLFDAVNMAKVETKQMIANWRWDLLLPKNLDNYFEYDGSLTTPPCSEVVEWIVFKEPVPISRKQLDYFHSIKHHVVVSVPRVNVSVEFNETFENERPVQPLDNRKIKWFPGSGSRKFTWLDAPIVLLTFGILTFWFSKV